MKMRCFNSILAVLIGISASLYGAEQDLPQVPEQVQIAEVAPAISDVEQQPTITPVADSIVTIATSDGQQIPMLIGFDLDLYGSYCQSRQSSYRWGVGMKLVSLTLGTIILSSQISAFVKDPASFAPITSKGISEWWNSRWYWMAAMIFYKAIPTTLWTGFQAFSFAGLAYSTLNSARMISSDTKNLFLWDAREELLQKTNQLEAAQAVQVLWHQEIYALFGRPEVVGTKPLTGTYLLKGHKKYGAGIVIFDPFDREQVKILLGIGRTHEDLRCSKIEIIPT